MCTFSGGNIFGFLRQLAYKARGNADTSSQTNDGKKTKNKDKCSVTYYRKVKIFQSSNDLYQF